MQPLCALQQALSLKRTERLLTSFKDQEGLWRHLFTTIQTGEMKTIVLVFFLLSGTFAAPFMKEKEAKMFTRLKRQVTYWDPNHSQNLWGYTLQEQANEYWTALRTDAQYYMDMGTLMFDHATAVENNKLYMDMLRNTRAHLDGQTRKE